MYSTQTAHSDYYKPKVIRVNTDERLIEANVNAVQESVDIKKHWIK